jgi:hypothetical protein
MMRGALFLVSTCIFIEYYIPPTTCYDCGCFHNGTKYLKRYRLEVTRATNNGLNTCTVVADCCICSFARPSCF